MKNLKTAEPTGVIESSSDHSSDISLECIMARLEKIALDQKQQHQTKLNAIAASSSASQFSKRSSMNSIKGDEQYTASYNCLIYAKSMEEILSNKLIKDSFIIEALEPSDTLIADDNIDLPCEFEYYLYCKVCTECSRVDNRRRVMATKVLDTNYSTGDDNMARWFSNLKKN